jgi:hypothetical protein
LTAFDERNARIRGSVRRAQLAVPESVIDQ